MLTYGGKITHFGALVFEQHHGPRWHGDQGHFIMACPAATWLSTGMSDEGERGHLRRQESRLRRGLIKISLDQECKQQRKRDRKRKKKDDPAFLPPTSHPAPPFCRPPLPSPSSPTGPSRCWQIDLLCRLRLCFAFCREPQWRSGGMHAMVTSSRRREEYRLRHGSFLRSLSILSALWIDQQWRRGSSHPSEWLIPCRDDVWESNLSSPVGWKRRKNVFWLQPMFKESPSCLGTLDAFQVKSTFFFEIRRQFVLRGSILPTWLDNIFQDPAH